MANAETAVRVQHRPPAASSPSQDDLIDLDEVMAKTHLSSSTIYLWMAQEKFPLAVRLSPRCVRWVRGEVEDWSRGQRKSRVALRAPPPIAVAAAPPRRGRGRPRKA